MLFVRKNILVISVLIVVCFLVKQTVNYSLASIQYYSAKAFLDKWSKEPQSVVDVEYSQALTSAKRAYELHPNLALYSDTISEVLQWGGYASVEKDKDKVYREALTFTHRSLKLRPSWSVTWINAAYIKWQLGELDEEFYFYLDRSSELGRNSHEVNLFFLEFGLFLIDYDLRKFFDLRTEIERRAILVLQSKITRIKAIEIIKKYNKEQLVCSWGKIRNLYRALCN